MNLSAIKTTAIRTGHRGLLVARKYTPEILTTVGIIGGVAAGVAGARATLKVDSILASHYDLMEIVNEQKASGANTDQEHAKNTAFVYTTTVLNIGKLYAPTIGLALSSVACIVGAHGIMRQRNAALVAAYSVLERGFNEYRKRVEDKFGVDEEFNLKHNVVETKKIKDENDKPIEIKIAGSHDPSIYARFFDETNLNWQRNAEFNRTFLQAQQNFANNLLQVRGHVFLNEIYDALGFERTQAGSVVGWVISKNGGDNYIDFGLFDGDRDRARRFINGDEQSILLDFNVDGVIWDKI